MDDNIKDLFIVRDDVNKTTIETLAKRVLNFGRITQEGSVVIDDTTLSKGDQLKLCLLIKYIGNSFDENIPKNVRPTELTGVLGQRMEAIGSGLSKLASEGFAKKAGRGEYSIFPYKIDSFLSDLENSESEKETCAIGLKRTSGGKKRKTTALSGIGKHIQQQVEDGFFNTPKLMSELIEKLKEENIFTDKRVIDKTLREIFVQKRRILQRIKNELGGKARWRYVLRK